MYTLSMHKTIFKTSFIEAQIILRDMDYETIDLKITIKNERVKETRMNHP